MTVDAWRETYGEAFMFSLTNEERAYFALNGISRKWERLTFCKQEGYFQVRTTIFFEEDCIVKMIKEERYVWRDGITEELRYLEYDTRIPTDQRKMILPFTTRGKPKKLTASAIEKIMPFGCALFINVFSENRFGEMKHRSEILLSNPRGNRRFPIGEREPIECIRTEEDFRTFIKYYISTCREDYFTKLQEFKSAHKMTVRYRPGDIFRMDYDRVHYCYGIITGELKQLKKMAELPTEHSFLYRMSVPITVRLYRLVTEDPNLSHEELSGVPLGEVIFCSDNDIIWGTHPIVDHRPLTPEDLYFALDCISQGEFQKCDGRYTMSDASLYIEWGFASTKLTYDQLSQKLRDQLDWFDFRNRSVFTGITPEHLSLERESGWIDSRHDLQLPKNRELRNEVFTCLGLDKDISFDEFAEKFGGLTRQEIINKTKR